MPLMSMAALDVIFMTSWTPPSVGWAFIFPSVLWRKLIALFRYCGSQARKHSLLVLAVLIAQWTCSPAQQHRMCSTLAASISSYQHLLFRPYFDEFALNRKLLPSTSDRMYDIDKASFW